MSQDGAPSVLIIGAGPTGMTAALELARFGIEVRIIEKTPEPATTSRAVGVQARTEEQYALGDLYVDGDLAETDVHIFSSEYGFMGLFPMGHQRFRLLASNPFSQSSKDTTPALDELQKIYDQRSPIAAKFRDLEQRCYGN